MLGNPADACGDCDEQSFVKGFERGFECGWSFGFDQGLAQYKKDSCDGGEAKFEGCTNNEYKSLESTPEPRNWGKIPHFSCSFFPTLPIPAIGNNPQRFG